jgi:hypothetical protein
MKFQYGCVITLKAKSDLRFFIITADDFNTKDSISISKGRQKRFYLSFDENNFTYYFSSSLKSIVSFATKKAINELVRKIRTYIPTCCEMTTSYMVKKSVKVSQNTK